MTLAAPSTTSPIGASTMSSAMPDAERYHSYLFSTLQPYFSGSVLEIGSGYGQYTRTLLEHGYDVFASDIDPEFVERLQALQGDFAHLRGVVQIDLERRESIQAALSSKPGTILCLNVLEHIKHDRECIAALYEFSQPGTTAIFLTPAHQSLYGFMDAAAGHHRRYTRQSLSSVFHVAGWKVALCRYVNPVGALGWYVRNRVFPPPSQNLDDPVVNRDIKLFDKYGVPLTRLLTPFTGAFFGQSVFIVARRPE